MRDVVVGVDFGTESARALVVDVGSGEELGEASVSYRSGVIDDTLPGGRRLPLEWALQDPADWLHALPDAVRTAVARARVAGRDVRGLGVDFTSSTVLPTVEDGTPLCALAAFADEPHAWPKLWKHHAAHEQAEELTALTGTLDPERLARYGGRISSEWLVPKAMQIVDESPETFAAADRIVEAGDWITWQLTGRLIRNSCAAGFKAMWHKRAGYPSPELLAAARPELAELFAATAGGDVAAPGTCVGVVSDSWLELLGLEGPVAVAAAIIDAHAGLIGAGVVHPGTLYLASGTSTCHLLLAPWERTVAGISGVVEDGIVAGVFAYEAGQVSVGDMFDWYVRLTGSSHAALTEAARALRPGESGLLALDWWNGCRTPLVDADLSGVLLGATVATPPGAVYRALLEATALGTRLVVDTFEAGGIEVERLVVGGGLAANDLVLQIYADVTGLPVTVAKSRQPSARGAAVLAAAAAGLFAGVEEASEALAPAPEVVFEPDATARAAYDELYGVYRELAAAYSGPAAPLKRLSALRRDVLSDLSSVPH